MHRSSGAQLVQVKGKRGWVLVTEALGPDPNDRSGNKHSDLTNKGLGIVVRVTLEHPSNRMPPSFVDEISADGQVWESVGHSSDDWDKVDVQFPPKRASRIRTQTTQASDLFT